MATSIDDQITCAERELKMRERVYPRRVNEGKMDDYKARQETEAMRAIIETLKEVRDAKLGGRLL